MAIKLVNELEGKDGKYNLDGSLWSYNLKFGGFAAAYAAGESKSTSDNMDFIQHIFEGNTNGYYDFLQIEANIHELTGITIVHGITFKVDERSYFVTLRCIGECISWCEEHRFDDVGVPMCSTVGSRELIQFSLNILCNEDLRNELDISDIDAYVEEFSQ
ncbi:hypothetical protein F7U66_00360 [Vibrio parahaemolyticus]|nr:hypothetical protein [Vibrio parahaemolyticus]